MYALMTEQFVSLPLGSSRHPVEIVRVAGRRLIGIRVDVGRMQRSGSLGVGYSDQYVPSFPNLFAPDSSLLCYPSYWLDLADYWTDFDNEYSRRKLRTQLYAVHLSDAVFRRSRHSASRVLWDLPG
jgi:hypothetical protein